MTPSAILLYGPSGSGKSTVGRLLAERLALPFVNLDDAIETRAGRAIPEIFATEGESRFRAWERETLERVLDGTEKVIALGGGALTVPSTRALAEKRGRVVLLHASPDTLLERLRADTAGRPLLQGNLQTRLRALLARRAAHYASFPLGVSTSGKTPAEVAWEVQTILGVFRLQSMGTPCDVRLIPGGLDALGAKMASCGLSGPVAVVADENVAALYQARVVATLRGSGFEAHGVTIPAGETYKTPQTVARLWEAFVSIGVERGSTILALGGGVTGDLTGFAAASYLRGVPWVIVPTSLLAMVDASLGGKTGADLPQGKNLIGAFHPPRLVLTDLHTLATLPIPEFINGLAEVVKHGVIGDPDLLPLAARAARAFRRDPHAPLLAEMVRRAMAVKIHIVEADPYEKGERAALNFGHTVGHGLELASGFRLRHGEAVSIGMVIEARLAEHIGLAPAGVSEEVAAVLSDLGLPIEAPSTPDWEDVIPAMRRDKKRKGGAMRFSLPAGIGDVRVGVTVDGWESLIPRLASPTRRKRA